MKPEFEKIVSTDSGIRTIRELIDRMAETRPAATFLVSPETGQELTFKGIQEHSVLLAEQLRGMGQERGDKVAFLLDNGLFTAQLFLGAMYGGFVSVPLNVRAGLSQLSYTLDHCDAKLVFVSDEYCALLHEVLAEIQRPIQVVTADLDHVIGRCAPQSPATPLPAPEPEDVALLMYSSGSTGQPKGAMHCHRSVLAHARNSVNAHQLLPADRSLLVLPLYHINAECVTLLPTLAERRLGRRAPAFQRQPVLGLAGRVSLHLVGLGADHHLAAPGLERSPRGEPQRGLPAHPFLALFVGAAVPALHREFLDKFKLLLLQAMGSTEAGNIFSNPLPPGENKIGSPGLPWGFEAKIVDREGVELPPGEPGEIFVRGPAMMQGYYKEPEATAAVLDRDGWLHTGDLAYRDEDGYFFVVGRSKELIIKGGVNIAPRQIDEVLESHPAVLEAAAVGVPDRYLGEDLMAFVVLRAGVSADERELLTFCESRLGHFKTPSRIHVVEDLPKGPSGKVQRLRLLDEAARPAMTASVAATTGSGFAAEYGDSQLAPGGSAAAASPIEQLIGETWAELLEEPQVDVQTNFFALGGDSLLAIRCLSRLREKLPIMLSLSDFFENATVAQQAALVRRRLSADVAEAGVPSPNGQASSDQLTAALEQTLLQKLLPTAGPQAIPPRDRALPCPLSSGATAAVVLGAAQFGGAGLQRG